MDHERHGALFDSILRGFPIGNLLLWQRAAPAEELTLGTVRVSAPALTDACYVVDGQQRVTSLVNALDPVAGREGPFALVLDLSRDPWRVRAASANDRDAILLPDLFALPRLLTWVRDHPEHTGRIDDLHGATARLRECCRRSSTR